MWVLMVCYLSRYYSYQLEIRLPGPERVWQAPAAASAERERWQGGGLETVISWMRPWQRENSIPLQPKTGAIGLPLWC
jgi:hypothetical protein